MAQASSTRLSSILRSDLVRTNKHLRANGKMHGRSKLLFVRHVNKHMLTMITAYHSTNELCLCSISMSEVYSEFISSNQFTNATV